MTCPRCGSTESMEVDLYFGFRNQIEYNLGDEIVWVERKIVKNGGRPPEGDLKGEAYTECPSCKKDFFVEAIVRGDKLIEVQVDHTRPGYVPD
ncbi:MAG: hypothetical protein R3C11_29075 [Planctomycetaceae bacterium]